MDGRPDTAASASSHQREPLGAAAVEDAVPDVLKDFGRRCEAPVIVYPGHGREGLIDQIDAAEKKLRTVHPAAESPERERSAAAEETDASRRPRRSSRGGDAVEENEEAKHPGHHLQDAEIDRRLDAIAVQAEICDPVSLFYERKKDLINKNYWQHKLFSDIVFHNSHVLRRRSDSLYIFNCHKGKDEAQYRGQKIVLEVQVPKKSQSKWAAARQSLLRSDAPAQHALYEDEIVHIPPNIEEECDFFNRYIKYDLIERPPAGKSQPKTTTKESARNSQLNL